MTRNTPPAPGEYEISVFGPGTGECIVVHLGEGSWAVIDSFLIRSAHGHRPVALAYLESLGVDVASKVDFVVASHWHDDHVKGMADLVAHCHAATFWASSALQGKEMAAFLAAEDPSTVTTLPSAADELRRALEVVRARRTGGRAQALSGPDWASMNKVMYRRGAVTVHALSPSSATQTVSLRTMLAQPKGQRRVLVRLAPNAVSVAMHLEFDNRTAALLGSDLECGTGGIGWSGILGQTQRPQRRADLYKVAHHGSIGADDPGIWTDLLRVRPDAVLTPFRTSGLPRLGQVAAIRLKCQDGWVTAQPTMKSGLPNKTKLVTKQLQQLGIVITPRRIDLLEDTGQVRFRWDGQQWNSATFGPAVTLESYHQALHGTQMKKKAKP